MADIKPFKINVPDTSLAKLKQKLELTRFPEGELEEAGWDYGAPLYISLSAPILHHKVHHKSNLPPDKKSKT